MSLSNVFCNMFIECSLGSYGENCMETCGNCLFGQFCDIASGQCPSGCEAGWGGLVCKTGEWRVLSYIIRTCLGTELMAF